MKYESISKAEINTFSDWVISFKKEAEKEGISKKTINTIMVKAIYLPKVIEYDRFHQQINGVGRWR